MKNQNAGEHKTLNTGTAQTLNCIEKVYGKEIDLWDLKRKFITKHFAKLILKRSKSKANSLTEIKDVLESLLNSLHCDYGIEQTDEGCNVIGEVSSCCESFARNKAKLITRYKAERLKTKVRLLKHYQNK